MMVALPAGVTSNRAERRSTMTLPTVASNGHGMTNRIQNPALVRQRLRRIFHLRVRDELAE